MAELIAAQHVFSPLVVLCCNELSHMHATNLGTAALERHVPGPSQGQLSTLTLLPDADALSGQVKEDFIEVVLSARQDDFFRKHQHSNFGDLGTAIKVCPVLPVTLQLRHLASRVAAACAWCPVHRE